jgi:inhibitor of KinA
MLGGLQSMVNNAYEFSPLGDSAVVIRIGDSIDLETNRKVKRLGSILEKHQFPGMIEYIPAFTTLTVFYDPFLLYQQYMESPWEKSHDRNQSVFGYVCEILEQIIQTADETEDSKVSIVEIPVCYGGDCGPDLTDVASHNGLTPDQVIDIHSSAEYIVYMIGFAPGFPYIGGMSERIATPRRKSPRLTIPAGSVGIAGMQTGVYPIETPGGWQLIGRTPMALFRPKENPPSLLQAGDIVRFKPMSMEEYVDWKEEEYV